MIYIYDVLLNFNKDLFEFFEWEDNDYILYVKKIPVIRVKTKVIYDIIDNKIKVDNNFLNLIKCKTKLYEERDEKKYKYACIFSDGFISVAVNFINGKSIYVSKMLLDEEKDVFDSMVKQKQIYFKYTCLEKRNKKLLSRKEILNKKLLLKEIKELYLKKNIEVLKYLYLEYFEEESDDIEFIYNKFSSEITNKYSEKFNNILDLIRLIKA